MNKCYIISYDLSNPGQNYERLIKKIKSYSTWANLGGSAYIIYTNSDTNTIRDYLTAELDRNDKLFVGILRRSASWYGLGDDVAQWLIKNLTD